MQKIAEDRILGEKIAGKDRKFVGKVRRKRLYLLSFVTQIRKPALRWCKMQFAGCKSAEAQEKCLCANRVSVSLLDYILAI